jgi:hypothetical protein
LGDIKGVDKKMTPTEKANKIMEGCKKHFCYNSYLKDMRICGRIEDLKHSGNIILCLSCQTSRQTAIDIFEDELEFLNKLKSVFVMDKYKNIMEEIKERIKELNLAMEILK